MGHNLDCVQTLGICLHERGQTVDQPCRVVQITTVMMQLQCLVMSALGVAAAGILLRCQAISSNAQRRPTC